MFFLIPSSWSQRLWADGRSSPHSGSWAARTVGAVSRISPRPAHSKFGLLPKVGVLCGKSEQTSACRFWSRVMVEGAQPGGRGLEEQCLLFLTFKAILRVFFLFPSLFGILLTHRAELPKLKLSTCPVRSEEESARGVWKRKGSGGAQIMNG